VTGQPRVPGLNDEWADRQLDLLAAVEAAQATVLAAPYQPDPAVCRNCTHVADVPGGPVFACESAPGCVLDALGQRERSR